MNKYEEKSSNNAAKCMILLGLIPFSLILLLIIEARRTIFEEALGQTQDNLASITIGFNRGRIVTYKLRQQIDVDMLYDKEFFEFERSMGQGILTLKICKLL